MSIKFWRWDIAEYEIFWKGLYAYAMVNTRPVVKHHVLVCPLRVIPSFCDLSTEELIEMNFAVSKITKTFGVCSIAIQDGKEAGQTVPHVHFHIIPRPQQGIITVDVVSADRSVEDMKEESEYLKKLIFSD